MTDLIKPMAEFSVEGPLKSISFDIEKEVENE